MLSIKVPTIFVTVPFRHKIYICMDNPLLKSALKGVKLAQDTGKQYQ